MYLQRGPPIAENKCTTHRTHRTHRTQPAPPSWTDTDHSIVGQPGRYSVTPHSGCAWPPGRRSTRVMLGHACETLAVMYLQRGPPIAENKSTMHRTHRTHRFPPLCSSVSPQAFYAFYAWWPRAGAVVVAFLPKSLQLSAGEHFVAGVTPVVPLCVLCVVGYFPQLRDLAEGTSRPVSHKHDSGRSPSGATCDSAFYSMRFMHGAKPPHDKTQGSA